MHKFETSLVISVKIFENASETYNFSWQIKIFCPNRSPRERWRNGNTRGLALLGSCLHMRGLAPPGSQPESNFKFIRKIWKNIQIMINPISASKNQKQIDCLKWNRNFSNRCSSLSGAHFLVFCEHSVLLVFAREPKKETILGVVQLVLLFLLLFVNLLFAGMVRRERLDHAAEDLFSFIF